MPKAMIHLKDAPDQAREILSRHDATEVADYRRSLLVRVDEAGLEELRAAGFRVREIPDQPVVTRGGYELDTSVAPAAAEVAFAAAPVAPPAGRAHCVLRLAGPLHPAWDEQLSALEVRIYESLAEDSYLVGCEAAALPELGALDFVESVTPYHPPLKVAAELVTADLQAGLAEAPGLAAVAFAAAPEPAPAAELTDVDVMAAPASDPAEVGNLELILFEAEDRPQVIAAVRLLGVEILDAEEEVVIVFADPVRIPELAAIREVREINPYGEPTLHNNVAGDIIGVDEVRDNHGLDGSGEVVAVADTGLDRGADNGTMSADFRGRIVSIHALGRPGDASDLSNHGTHVAGSVLGSGANSNGSIRGMAPAAELVFQSVMDAGRGLGGLPANLASGLFDVARDDGAAIHTNSWGFRSSNGNYNFNSRQTDRFAFDNRDFLILFSAGNDAPFRVTAPGTAKNALTVGASESVRQLPASVNFPASPRHPAGLTLNLEQNADDADHVASFSSPGPAAGNRRKPDVVAPGTFILSARSAVSTADTGPDGLRGTQDEDGVFTHAEAVGRGLPGGPLLGGGDRDAPDAPAGSGAQAQESYCYDSGTSMATPITAGASALVRQFLRQELGHAPSAALLKALIVNGARSMGGAVPDHRQGWGRIDLRRTLSAAGPGSVQFDDTLAHAMTTGEIRTYRFSPVAAGAPIAVTLVWRDPEGMTLQNRLHLRVFDPSNQELTSDPENLVRDNVQKVEIDAAEAGVYTVEVEALGLFEGVPELLPERRQDFALVVANADQLAMAF